MSFTQYAEKGSRKVPEFRVNENLEDPAKYIPGPELVSAVNVALSLGQPLLLTGEPGTGKTQLAHHMAHFFGLEKPLVFNAQTTSKAVDLFYTYDALGHFQYNQNNPTVLEEAEVENRFIRYQALGEAICSQSRKVVLIDEIDKAPRDLPNDVLAAIEGMSFFVPELGKTYTAQKELRPIVIITSNSEKNLPDAFLRRVVYYHIPFPDDTTLLRIVSTKIKGYNDVELAILIKHFEQIRSNKDLRLKKKPATAELIFWAMLLHRMEFDPKSLGLFPKLKEPFKEQLLTSYSVLAKTQEDLKALRGQLR
ncbi:MAG: MoxR family ATPase [Bacteroidota bacterium]